MLGIINLNEIKNWDKIKGKSIYVNAKLDASHYMENAKHIGFKFKTTFPTEFLEFTCELLDDKAEQIFIRRNKSTHIRLTNWYSKMSSKDDNRSIANEFKTMFLNTKKKMKEKDNSLKKVRSVHEMTKK